MKNPKPFQLNQWPDKTTWFLTDSTYLHFPYFNLNEQKEIVLNQFREIREKFGVKISDYSISSNHYHLKFYLEKGNMMLKIKQSLRGAISFRYRRKYDVKYSEIWHSRRILPIKSEDMDWKVSGYIAGNLLKHREVDNFGELAENSYSSFSYKAKNYGVENVKDLVLRVIDVCEDADGEVDLKQLINIRLKP